MSNFLKWKRNLYPLLAFFVGAWLLVTGLIFAPKGLPGTYLISLNYLILLIFLPWKSTLRPLPIFIIVGGIFFGIYYGVKGELETAIVMVNRIAAIFVAIMPGIAVKPVSLVRNLEQFHCPKTVTLGMLITYSFGPLLVREIKRINEAMGTRGVKLYQPKNFYRAFMVPFIVRLINISDTLSLSVETRGFKMSRDCHNTLYKKEWFTISDLVCCLSLISVLIGVSFI